MHSSNDSVWIVLQDASPDNTVLGVFLNRSEADRFAKEITDAFPGHVLVGEYQVGYKFNSAQTT